MTTTGSSRTPWILDAAMLATIGAFGLSLSRAHAQPRGATQAAAASGPSEADQARMQSQVIVSVRRCLHDNAWTLSVEAVFMPSGRVRLETPTGAQWAPQQSACLTRAAATLRPARRPTEETRATWTLAGADPRPLLLRSIDVVRCVPTFNPCQCHIVAAVALSARRPGRMAAATFDVHDCVVDPVQLQCLEQAVSAIRFPVHPGEPENFRGPLGGTCHE